MTAKTTITSTLNDPVFGPGQILHTPTGFAVRWTVPVTRGDALTTLIAWQLRVSAVGAAAAKNQVVLGWSAPTGMVVMVVMELHAALAMHRIPGGSAVAKKGDIQ